MKEFDAALYWVVDGNAWSKNKYSEQEAQIHARTLIDCVGCVDCKWCMDCSDCKDCLRCIKCVDSSRCKECESCTHCMDCEYCAECRECESWCFRCVNCAECIDCEKCTYCFECEGCDGCTDCEDCVECEECGNCSRCKWCRDCLAVLDCESSSALEQCSDCVKCKRMNNCSECVGCEGCKYCIKCTDCDGCDSCEARTGKNNFSADDTEGAFWNDERIVVKKSWLVYGRNGDELKASYDESSRQDASSGKDWFIVDYKCADVTGSNDYLLVTVLRNTAAECRDTMSDFLIRMSTCYSFGDVEEVTGNEDMYIQDHSLDVNYWR